MQLHHSNRMQSLAVELARLVRADPGDPFTPERIVVPHRTIERWLSLELASELGIAANICFELPAGFAWSIMRDAVPGGLSGESMYTPAQLRWRIHDILPRFVEGLEESAVRGYLADGDPRKRFELSDRLARVFDRCLLYRPDWIREWERGPAPHWQARLWRCLIEADGSTAADGSAEADGLTGAGHWVAAIDAFHARLAVGGRPAGWPRRAIFFGVSTLSPLYIEMLRRAGEGIDIHLFMLDPCREYWGDIYSRREIGHKARGADPGARYLTEGNELLAAWGRGGRDTFDALIDIAQIEWEEHFVPPTGASRLAAVQRDILDLCLAHEAAKADASREALPEGAQLSSIDDSLQIHVCHSPVREAEVLHDRLLALFDAHHDMEPADVLVLTPDLELYGPAIDAVFGAAGRIPCNVARARAGETRTLRALLELLALPGSRHGAEAVLVPLAAPAIRARFGIGEADLSTIRYLVGESGIRWGVNEAHRGEQSLPATADHTWQQGLRRLLLGYAMTDANELVGELTPCSIKGRGFGGREVNGELLGRFVSYCDAVFGLRGQLAGERRPAQWAAVLRDVVRRFLADGSGPVRGAGGTGARPLPRELADETSAIRALIRDFEREAERAQSPTPFEVVLDVLRERAHDASREPARLADGVTVASLGPGRIFPARAVCVVGMNDGSFPRSPATPSFDLIAAGPAWRGDHDIRHEDRFAFLEALLAARHCFFVSCSGRGLHDDAPIPPSVVVDELKDYLGRRFPGAAVETHHPLQPFSPRYFAQPAIAAAQTAGEAAGKAVDGAAGGTAGAAVRGIPGGASGGGDLFSYSQGMCEAARAMLAGRQGLEAPGRFEAALPEPDDSRRRVAFGDLVAFFANPTCFFLHHRLDARLEAGDAVLDEDEPFRLDNLERFRLRSEIWDRMQAGAGPERTAALLRGSGGLPQAGLGRIVHERAQEEMEQLDRQLARYRAVLEAPPREIDFELGGFRVVGAIDHVGPNEGGSGKRIGAGKEVEARKKAGASKKAGADRGGRGRNGHDGVVADREAARPGPDRDPVAAACVGGGGPWLGGGGRHLAGQGRVEVHRDPRSRACA